MKKTEQLLLGWRKKFIPGKKIYFHKHVLLNNIFFLNQRGGTVEELFAYIFGIYIRFG